MTFSFNQVYSHAFIGAGPAQYRAGNSGLNLGAHSNRLGNNPLK